MATLLLFAGCTKPQVNEVRSSAVQEEAKVEEPIPGNYEPVQELPQLEGVKKGDTIATIHTSKGDIKVWFFPEYAPKAVENFTTHAKEGYYNGVTFHRVIKDMMIQSGDPTGEGGGGESIWGESFENEVTPNLRNFRGALCMANSDYLNPTNNSQFYIVQASNKEVGNELANQVQGDNNKAVLYGDNVVIGKDGKPLTNGEFFSDEVVKAYGNLGGYPSLDMKYTVFGQVYEGIEVVDAIDSLETDENHRPLEDVTITGIEVGTYQ